MDYPKSTPNVGLVNGKFVDENTTTGQVGSLIPAEWGNAVTDELLNVIRAGGAKPAEAEHDQLLAAIKVIVRDSIPPEKIRTTLAEYGITDAYTKSVTYTKAEIDALLKNMSALPVGAMVPFPKGTVPPGFLEVDASVQSAAVYPDLATYLGGAFNKGDEGAGNFRLPESRGEFLRGWDHGRGIDAGRAVGSYQIDALQNITGAIGDFPRGSTGGQSWYGTGALSVTLGGNGPGSDGAGVSWSQATFDASRVARTSTETRPRNLAVMWCIKAWNAPINQGNIDIAALAAQVIAATPKDYVAGFTTAMNIAAPTTTIDVAPGTARGSSSPVFSTTTISGVLQAAGAWSPGTGGNKLDTGARAALSWYHVFLLRKVAGGEADLLFSLSLAAPTVPPGYEVVTRLKGRAIKTDASSSIIPFINTGNSTDFKTIQQDMLVSSVLTNSYTLTVSVPPGVRARARFYARMQGESSVIYVRSPEAAVVTLGNTVVAGFVGGIGTSNDATTNENVSGYCEAMTSAAGQVVVQVHVYPGYTGGFASLHTQGWTEE